MRGHVFYNPDAGHGTHTKADLKSAMKLAGVDAKFFDIKRVDVAQVLAIPTDIVVVAGGDGTVATIIRDLVNRDTPVGIIPLGTANNIARSSGVFGTAADLTESWHPEHWRALDIGVAGGSFGKRKFIEAVGIGPLAKLMKKGEKLKSRGAAQLRDGRELLAELVGKAKLLDVILCVDGMPVPGDLLALEITSLPYTGPGLHLAPSADPGDGVLEVILIETDQRQPMMDWLRAPRGAPPVTTYRGKEVDIIIEGTPVRFDDEYVGAPKQAERISMRLETSPARVLQRRAPAANARPRELETT